ncbi:MAG: hypothetical protein EOP84_35970, partial [Verrucomicrobiaceae bacterium]
RHLGCVTRFRFQHDHPFWKYRRYGRDQSSHGWGCHPERDQQLRREYQLHRRLSQIQDRIIGQRWSFLSDSTLVWDTGSTENISTRTVGLGGTSVTLDTNGNNVLLTNTVGNGGSASIVKAGEGKLTFASTPTYTGSTTISGGILQLGNGGATVSVQGNILNNAELALNFTGGTTFSNIVTGTGGLIHSGSGQLNLSSANTHSGTTSINSASATLLLGDALALQNSTLSYVASGGTVSFGSLTAVTLGGLAEDKNLVLQNNAAAALALSIGNNNQTTNYMGGLSGAGSLVKIGTGISYLTGINTYAGTTTVSGGDLELVQGEIHGSGVITTAGTNGRMSVSGGMLATT